MTWPPATQPGAAERLRLGVSAHSTLLRPAHDVSAHYLQQTASAGGPLWVNRVATSCGLQYAHIRCLPKADASLHSPKSSGWEHHRAFSWPYSTPTIDAPRPPGAGAIPRPMAPSPLSLGANPAQVPSELLLALRGHPPAKHRRDPDKKANRCRLSKVLLRAERLGDHVPHSHRARPVHFDQTAAGDADELPLFVSGRTRSPGIARA